MSSTFDTLQQALDFLHEQIKDDSQMDDIIFYTQAIIARLHDYSHAHRDILNRVAGIEPELLRTALKYTDDEERQSWLKLKAGN